MSDRCHDARFADSFRFGLVCPFATPRVSFMCNDRKEPRDTALSGALVGLKPYRHPVDFSSLVLPVGRGRTLLAVPLLATFKIFCDRIESLRRVGSLLGRP